MEELKRRIAVLDDAMRPFRSRQEMTVPNLELAALQLRKCYELVGFASISANRQRYGRIRKRFEKDWKLSEILNRIEALNPQFLPQGVRLLEGDGSAGHPHGIESKELEFKKADLLRYHGMLGPLMHAANPYGKQIDYLKWHKWLCSRRDELVDLLSNHVANIEFQRTFYLCSMRVLPNDEVSVSIFNITDMS